MTTIARNAESQGDLIAWWDEEELDDEVEVSCGASEAVVILSGGEPLVELPPGRHAITADTHEELEDWLDGDDESIEVAFLTTVPVDVDVGASFVRNDQDEAEVSGSARVRVTDASAATGVLERLSEGESLEDWVGDEIAVHLLAAIDGHEGKSVLDLTSGAYDEELIEEALKRANEVLGEYGIEAQALGPLGYVIEEETQARLRAEAEEQARANIAEAEKASGPTRIWTCPNRHGTTTKGGACPVCKAQLVLDV